MKGKAEIVVGAQWGDEGKGRIVDVMARNADAVVRYQGGANAGHTVMTDDEKYIFHLLPSGMLYPGKTCVVGNGVVVDPEQLIKELRDLQEKGKDRARLVISKAAHVVMPYHKAIDTAEEKFRGRGHQIGTTQRGIGPCYVDKVSRIGIRIEDLANPQVLREKLQLNLEIKNLVLSRVYGETPISFDEIYDKALSWGSDLAPYMGDSSLVIHEVLGKGGRVLFEGAQGTLLDVDHGTYPYVTSSHPVSGGACIGAGIGPTRIDKVIGVAKAYCTRVGEGPFPTEETGEAGNTLRERGYEYGATTGRPRRCGWLDMVALRHSIRINDMHGIALTKLDVLQGMKEIKICYAYEINGKEFQHFPTEIATLAKVRPCYKSLRGWEEDIGDCKTFEDLPQVVREYIETIEEIGGVPVIIIGVGPKREQTILRF